MKTVRFDITVKTTNIVRNTVRVVACVKNDVKNTDKNISGLRDEGWVI